MKPLILITSSVTDNESFLKVNRAYMEAIEKAGGIALIPDCANIENIPDLLEISNGVLLTGGVDIDPCYFGEFPIRELGEVTPMRDAFEIELVKGAVKTNKAILAICRGAQIMNVALGGKVYQDIYAQAKAPLIKHSQEMPKSSASHPITLRKGSKIEKIMNVEEMRVNSFHHQAVSVLGKNIIKTASAPDGITEAIEHKDMDFCLGVQWHPETMTQKYPAQFEIFKEFISHAENNIKKRV